MADSAAERQRRSRQHKAGDHSDCKPGRCDGVTSHVTRDGRTRRPREDTLGPAGREVWDEQTKDLVLSATEAAVLLEACRTVDRLERLDGMLRGRDRKWLEIEWPEGDATEFVVVVDKALSEARQQQTALKGLLAEFRQSAPRAPQQPAVPKGATDVVSITDRVRAKLEAAKA